jgi:hypothetical protein
VRGFFFTPTQKSAPSGSRTWDFGGAIGPPQPLGCRAVHELGYYGNIGIGLFDGTAPSLADALTQTGEERWLWELARAIGISSLMAPLSVD